MTTGGTLGGITSGQLLVFRVGIKPASSISQDQAGVQAEAVGVGEFLGPRFVAVDPILWKGIQLGWSLDERGDAVRNVSELSRW